MTFRVALVVPDRELWSGEARTVIAKTTEGDIGVLTGHSPVFGVLAVDRSVASRVSYGGTAPNNVRAQAKKWLKTLASERS